jgi:anti-sigma regulatory factor (Ser/Thr protein kinase)
MAVVELLLSPLPSHVRTARLVVLAAARRAGLEDGLVDEIRLAVSEACSRAVGLNARHAADVPVRLLITDDPTGLTLSVIDAGPASDPAPGGDLSETLVRRGGEDDEVTDPSVALAVLTGLVDEVDVEPGPTGTTVTMRWPLPAGATAPGTTALSRA